MDDAKTVDRSKAFWDSLNTPELYRFFFEEAADGIFIGSPQGRYLAVNPRAVALTGYSAEELLGMSAADLIPAAELTTHAIRMADFRPGRDAKIETRIRRRDGVLLEVEISSRMLPEGNRLDVVADITERKRAEIELRERERHLRQSNLVLENSSVVVFRWRAVEGWPVAMVSRNVIQFGYTSEELLSGVVPFAALVHPEDLERVGREVREYSESGAERFQQEYRVVTKDGAVRWVDDRTVVERGADGQILFYQGIVVDITERKSAEAELRERENMLGSIFRASPTGIGVVSDRVLLAVNDRVCEMIGRSRDELIGRSARVLYPGDADFEYVGTEKYRQIRERGTGSVETRWQCKDGRIIDVLMSSTPIEPGNLAAGVTFTALDITERKQAEAALRQSEREKRTILDSLTELVIYTDPSLRLLWANQAACESAGLPREALIGKPCYAVWGEGEGPCPGCVLAQAMLSRRTHKAEKTTPDGRTWFNQGYPVLDEHGEIVGGIEVVLEITERKRAEEALRSSLEEKESLLKEVHHRVKNTLQVISSLLNLQVRQAGSASVRSFLQDTQNRVRSMAVLHEILYRSGNLARISFPQYVKSICAHLARSYAADAGNIRLRREIADISLSMDQAVPAGLIINELVSNAFKHAFPDRAGGEILVQVRSDDDQRLVLHVADDGVGMPADPKNQGVEALGLRLVDNLVRQLDGQLTIRSDPGAAFQIVFPVRPAERSDA